jgi:Glyoxalase-like domain
MEDAMPLRIDHVIAAGSDLDALERGYTQLGFFVTGGGTHPHLGTRNRIIVVGEGYIELLALDVPERASEVLRQRLERGPGWIGFAVQSGDIETEAAAMRGRGVAVLGPNPGRLVAPNGQARSWRIVTVDTADLWQSAEPLPFLIQHDATSEQHRQELAGGLGGLAPHANGATRVTEVVVAVRDLDDAARRYAVTYDLHPATPVQSDASLGARVLVLPLDGGHEHIRLAQPEGPGIVADRIDTAGDGLCLISVAVGDLQQTEIFLGSQGIPFAATEAAITISADAAGGATLRFVESR